MRRPGGRALVALALASLTTFVLAAPARAVDAPGPRATIELLEQPAWSPVGADVPLSLRIAGDSTGLEVRAVVHGFVTSRTAFERTVEGERLGSVVATGAGVAPAALPLLDGRPTLVLPLQDPNAARDPARLRVSLPSSVDAGVFPVEVELRDPQSGERVDGFVTHLVLADVAGTESVVGQPLRTSWIWRLHADPALQPGGQLSPGFRAAVGAGGRLTRIAAAVAQAGSVPLTLEVGPETAQSWALAGSDDAVAATGISRLRAAAATNQVLSGPYVDLDVPSLDAAGFGPEVTDQLAAGADSLDEALQTRVDPRTSALAPLDSGALAHLRTTGVDRVVVEPDALVDATATSQFTPAQPFALESDGRTVAAVQTSPALAGLLDGDAAPALRAQRLLAALSVIALEQPNVGRGIVLDTPSSWNPDLVAVQAVVSGLAGHPLLAPVTVDQLFDQVPPEEGEDGAVLRQLAPVGVTPPPVRAESYRATGDRLAAFGAMLGTVDPGVATAQRVLRSTLSTAYVGNAGGRQRLAAIDGAIDTFLAGIQTVAGRAVTLTSRDGEIPMSLDNKTGRPVRVRVQVESQKLAFPEGDTQVVELPPNNTTIRFPVESRASGTFPLQVRVSSEDGRLPIQQVRYTVRSTAVSGVGVFLTAGAGVFLAGWWITHWRRSKRRPVPTPALAT